MRINQIVFLGLLIPLLIVLPVSSLSQDQWIKLDYSDLVDKGAVLRSGQTLGSALGSNGQKGALQPFLDKYSYLLEYATELLTKEELAFTNVVDRYPIGLEQPAWVALFRSGRISAYTDNKRTVRLFLQGQNPRTAYLQNYSVIRHLLNSIKPVWGKLQVEVYVFENDYRTLSLRLNPTPALLKGSYFGTPSGKIPLDLNGLSEFFNQGGQLEGGQLSEKTGLQLFAKNGSAQTLAGKPQQLADFAVAYRAVFHAGDNKAFISLDPHKDITKATVNFGGFLEDTALGKVVLEADKRFKTITSGLDPNSGKDVRNQTRQHVPDFLTVGEREMKASVRNKGWVKTRFWFYPDSIEVQSDTAKHFAKIINPRFVADAERSRDDFNSSAEFNRKKKSLLSPAIRQNIDDLNRNYDKYTQVFPEFRELVTVGRLMAIASWLYRANPRWLDLDALLSVNIPATSTERERTQLIASASLFPGNNDRHNDDIKSNLVINYLSPDLDRPISQYFPSQNDLASFLALKSGSIDNAPRYQTTASGILKNQGGQAVRSLIKSQQDLQAFAIFAGRKNPLAENSAAEYKLIEVEKQTLDSTGQKLNVQKQQLEELQAEMKADPSFAQNNLANYNSAVENLNQDIKAYQLKAEAFNKRVLAFNQNQKTTGSQIIEIGGGINLESESFKIRTVENSPQLNNFKKIAVQAKPEWTSINKDGSWVTNKVTVKKEEAQKPVSFSQPVVKTTKTMSKAGHLKDRASIKLAIKKEIVVRIADPSAIKIKGEVVGSRTIVFKRAVIPADAGIQ